MSQSIIWGWEKSEIKVMQINRDGPRDTPPLNILLGQLSQPNFYTSLIVVTPMIIDNKITNEPIQYIF